MDSWETGPNATSWELPNKLNQINDIDVMMLVTTAISCIGIIANLTVIVVFVKHKGLRSKIPNRFIINQVRMLPQEYLPKVPQCVCVCVCV